MGDVALVPQRHVVERHLRVALHHACEAAHALGRDGVALVGHGRRTLLPLRERLLSLDHVGLLKQTHLHGDGLERGRNYGEGRHHLGVTVACEHLRGQRIGREAELFAHVLLHERIDARVRAHGTADGARGGNFARLLDARLSALEGPSPAAELHAERHRLGVDAVRAAHAKRVFELERAALARLAKLLDIGQNNVNRLRDLI